MIATVIIGIVLFDFIENGFFKPLPNIDLSDYKESIKDWESPFIFDIVISKWILSNSE